MVVVVGNLFLAVRRDVVVAREVALVVGKENELIVSRVPDGDVSQEFVDPLGDGPRPTNSGGVDLYGEGRGGTGGTE